MSEYGLLGRKLSHSYSPQIHSLFADYKYDLIELEPNELDDFFAKSKFKGLNVTIPYKKDVMKYCDTLSNSALKIGSVNTLIKHENGKISGYNTDYFGFMYMLKKSGIIVENKKVLVLGSGGASLTVIKVLNDLNTREVITISRKGENNYTNISNHFDADVIINTTPVGMYPNVSNSPLNLIGFKNISGVLDIIYNPDKTMLLQQAESLSIPNINGLSMLVAQAKQSVELFLSKKIDDVEIERALKEFKI